MPTLEIRYNGRIPTALRPTKGQGDLRADCPLSPASSRASIRPVFLSTPLICVSEFGPAAPVARPPPTHPQERRPLGADDLLWARGTMYNDFDISLTHLSSLASTNAVSTVPVPRGLHHAVRCLVLIGILSALCCVKISNWGFRLSRRFRAENSGSETTDASTVAGIGGESSAGGGGSPTMGATGVLGWLLPVLDEPNHSPDAPAELVFEPDAVVLRNRQPLAPGEQVILDCLGLILILILILTTSPVYKALFHPCAHAVRQSSHWCREFATTAYYYFIGKRPPFRPLTTTASTNRTRSCSRCTDLRKRPTRPTVSRFWSVRSLGPSTETPNHSGSRSIGTSAWSLPSFYKCLGDWPF